MKRKAGFTLVELLITITIMVILLILVVVNLRNNQAAARDEKRTTDVKVIAQQLEGFYTDGLTVDTAMRAPGRYTASLASATLAPVLASFSGGCDTVCDTDPGQYPPVNFMDSEDDIKLTLPNIDPKVLHAPDTTALSLTAATASGAQTPTTSQYIYQPLHADGTICSDDSSGECRKFVLYYKLETQSAVQTIMSKHQ